MIAAGVDKSESLIENNKLGNVYAVSAGYSLLQNVTQDVEFQKLIVTAGVLATFFAVIVTAASKIRTVAQRKEYIVPKKFSVTALFDTGIEMLVGLHDSIAGRQNRKYASLSITMFFSIFLLNIIGLVPGMSSPTTTVSTTVSFALVVFLTFNFYGIREQGLWTYLKHFAGPVWWLAPLLFPLEILSTVLRILTLNLRLYWNITADHIVLGVFTNLTKYVIPVIFYGLGTFVCFMQAFVFTILTMVDIFLAVDHGAEEEHHH